jgi:riboflavin synthase alpha subunit
MFTGIVRELGRVVSASRTAAGSELRIGCRTRAKLGDSVCVNGVCLSARPFSGGLAFDVVHETLSKTNLGSLASGDRVNLEPSLRHGDPLGGHFVMGHVDGVGKIESRTDLMSVRVPRGVIPFLAPKGSVAVDGVSLTVVTVGRSRFTVALIPLTLEKTTLGIKSAGDAVNIEVDAMARYSRRPPGVTREFLRRAGFLP